MPAAQVWITIVSQHGFGQGFRVPWLDKNAPIGQFDHLADYTVNGQNGGPAGSHIVEDFVRVSGSEHGDSFQDGDTHISGSQKLRHAGLGLSRNEAHVGDPEFFGAANQVGALFAIPYQDEENVSVPLQVFGSQQHGLQVVG